MRKAIGLALALAWLALPAHAQFMPLGVAAPQSGGGGSAPTIHGTAVKADSNTTTGVCPALTTSVANTTLYIAAHSGMPGVTTAPLVSGVANTGTASLTWGVLTRAGGHDATVRDATGGSSGTSQILTIWRARAASAGTYNITVTWNVDVDAGSVICWAVAGDNATNPQDANTALAVTNLGSAAPPSVTGYSITATNSLGIAAQASYAAGNCTGLTPTPVAGWTKLLDNQDSGGGSNYSCLEVDYKSFTSAQSGVTVTSGNTGTGGTPNYQNWSAVVTALVP